MASDARYQRVRGWFAKVDGQDGELQAVLYRRPDGSLFSIVRGYHDPFREADVDSRIPAWSLSINDDAESITRWIAGVAQSSGLTAAEAELEAAGLLVGGRAPKRKEPLLSLLPRPLVAGAIAGMVIKWML